MISTTSKDLIAESLERIKFEYRHSTVPWFIGFSGGKDSSAVLKLVFQALLLAKNRDVPVHLVYCDTGVEIPVIRTFVHSTLASISIEARASNLPLSLQIVLPPVEQRYFVKVIGRGYPPPTNKFRWCTDRLRVNPVRQTITELSKQHGSSSSIVLLGLRKGESAQRDRTLSTHRTEDPFFQKQSGASGVRIFAPIIKFKLRDVWNVIDSSKPPTSIDGNRLRVLYRNADGECPVLRESTSQPCAGNRFGCWTCTVVRRDKAVEGLIESGESDHQPLLDFRNWLAEIRDQRQYREKYRRNGMIGPGPFTLKAREEILTRLIDLQLKVGRTLIAPEEIDHIKRLWLLDYVAET